MYPQLQTDGFVGQARTEFHNFTSPISLVRSPEQRIRELEIENAYLRDAASAFGALAERLNQQLIELRRVR